MREAKEFTAIVKLINKQYNRRARAWDIELSVESASGLPYALKTLHCTRDNAKYIVPDKLYKLWGWRWSTGECAIEWLENFSSIMQVIKKYLKEKFIKQEY
jgi:hypothetical protein